MMLTMIKARLICRISASSITLAIIGYAYYAYFIFELPLETSLRHFDYHEDTSLIDMSVNIRKDGDASLIRNTCDINQHILGYIWPAVPSNSNSQDQDQRMLNQIQFINDCWSASHIGNLSLPIKKPKVILKVGWFNFENIKLGQGHFIDERCPINACEMSADKSKRATADALLISEFNTLSSWLYLPKPKHQIWIAQHWESPKHNRINPTSVKDLINWTASYRRDSTIQVGYGYYVKIKGATPITGIDYTRGKTKKVAWLVSNCRPSNSRKAYVRELSKHISVDVYGNCGTLSCPKNEPDCFKWLSRQYKFYLAFENSDCKDYITEKFLHNSLTNNILPVVSGAYRQDYVAAAPPHSYIHVDDFSSPREVAQYLHVLDKNDTLYNTYFAWKGTMTTIDQRYWCRLCMMLHLADHQKYVHYYRDYENWWNGACSR